MWDEGGEMLDFAYRYLRVSNPNYVKCGPTPYESTGLWDKVNFKRSEMIPQYARLPMIRGGSHICIIINCGLLNVDPPLIILIISF